MSNRYTHAKIRRGRKLFVTLLLFSFCYPCFAQNKQDTLSEFNIRSKKEELITNDTKLSVYSPGQKIVTIDSATLKQFQLQNIATLLSQKVPVFIKSYGFNGLSTLNFRGSSASQSQVYWNGIPIQNAALGIADISLLPVSFTKRLHVVYGSSSALWGSGNVGGALILESGLPLFDSIPKKNYELALGAGSFGQYQFAAGGSLQRKKVFFSANAFLQTAQNDFEYKDNNTTRTNLNSKLNGLAFQAQAAIKATEKDLFKIVGWYQRYDREIPAALFESHSVKTRQDQSWRLNWEYNRKTKFSEAYSRSAFLYDQMQYDDDAIDLHSANHVYSYFNEHGWNRKLGLRHRLLVIAPVHISWMDVNDNTKYQTKYALAAAYSYSNLSKRFNAAVNARGEIINQKSIFLPGVNASYFLFPWLQIRANIQKTYRAPNLNELYYEPGGNKDLKPEQGWAADAGYRLDAKLWNKISFLHDLSAFNRVIDDWIIWFGGSIWTPHNIAAVHSRGIETENFLSVPIRKWKFHLGLNTSYTLATTISSYQPNDGSIGKQIPYTPRYQVQANAGFTYRDLYFNYNYGYTGYRFITMDESPPYLLPYSVSNLRVSYSLHKAGHTFSVFAQLNNLFDESYAVVGYRPMPGRYWALGLSMMKE